MGMPQAAEDTTASAATPVRPRGNRRTLEQQDAAAAAAFGLDYDPAPTPRARGYRTAADILAAADQPPPTDDDAPLVWTSRRFPWPRSPRLRTRNTAATAPTATAPTASTSAVSPSAVSPSTEPPPGTTNGRAIDGAAAHLRAAQILTAATHPLDPPRSAIRRVAQVAAFTTVLGALSTGGYVLIDRTVATQNYCDTLPRYDEIRTEAAFAVAARGETTPITYDVFRVGAAAAAPTEPLTADVTAAAARLTNAYEAVLRTETNPAAVTAADYAALRTSLRAADAVVRATC